ncbi:MAG: hypothetical protein KAT00_07325 [Planctomycetes bacterium]|nr:hypothetical protein [Planctomycetota bacterium]
MGCCGGKVKTAKNIATGFVNLSRGKKYEFTDDRIRECHKCDDCTWLTKLEYAEWLAKHGIDVLKNFDDLTALPPLPKKEYRKGAGLYCRLCKCFIPAKARNKEKKCPLNRWER